MPEWARRAIVAAKRFWGWLAPDAELVSAGRELFEAFDTAEERRAAVRNLAELGRLVVRRHGDAYEVVVTLDQVGEFARDPQLSTWMKLGWRLIPDGPGPGLDAAE